MGTGRENKWNMDWVWGIASKQRNLGEEDEGVEETVRSWYIMKLHSIISGHTINH